MPELTKEQEKEIIEQKKREYIEKQNKNLALIKKLKLVVYALTTILFVLLASYFILYIMMDKRNIFLNDICLPVGIICFGGDGLLISFMNPRISASNDTKGDRLVFILSAIIILFGIGLLIYRLVA